MLKICRSSIKIRPRVPDWKTALSYGVLTMVGKWANLYGQFQYFRDRAAGKNTRLIDYKAASGPSSCATPITKPT